jgi:hypothetical protein
MASLFGLSALYQAAWHRVVFGCSTSTVNPAIGGQRLVARSTAQSLFEGQNSSREAPGLVMFCCGYRATSTDRSRWGSTPHANLAQADLRQGLSFPGNSPVSDPPRRC